MSTAKLTKADLYQFTGSEHWYRHGLVRNIVFTDGAKYVADAGGAYWLLDEIALAQRHDKVSFRRSCVERGELQKRYPCETQ